ncbi:hypothetical protein M406DRAFT_20616, partial [Cryphonectria parasitica EP155]
EPIAVVGSGCRFPGGASSPSSLWKLLEKPRDVSKAIPDERFELKGYYHPKGSHHGTTNVQRAYMLDEDVRRFDGTFFNISPNEADAIDPQQRLLMEVVYEALEAGGHTIEKLRGSDTAVMVGTMSVDYNDILIRDMESMPTYFSTGTSRAILANRISYFFDWHGPSMTIDTACSSSMVALHQSVRALRGGESRVAIAGGTELLLGPEQFVGESKMSLLSPTGRSRMWSADADGYARGDGIAALVLKRLSDAIADGDHIECLIRETGVNQDGKSTGLTVPSTEAQAALIKATYARAGLDTSNPRDRPQFFEAHGTGTKAGDPREAAAIKECFGGQQASEGNPLYVGSIKTIIGHTEGTAGLAGVLKASQALRHGIIPPNMLLTRLNPDVEQYCDNLAVPTKAIAWPTLPDGVPRRASVNSFGFGGTNGHAILESYVADTPSTTITAGENHLTLTPFVFSAATEDSLVSVLQKYSDFLKTDQGRSIDLHDLGWTLQSRRSALPFKKSFSALSPEALAFKIDKALELAKGGAAASGTSVGTRSATQGAKPQLLGVFTGQGAQWPTMGAGLLASPVVQDKIKQLDESLATLPEPDRPSWKIADELCAGKEQSRLKEAALAQPLCTALQVVLVDLLRSAGVTFTAVVGHSSGEIAAAYAAGFISAKDAIRIAYYRGVHAKSSRGPQGQKGSMMAVGTSFEDAQELLDLPAFKGRVKIAAQNSAASLTLSGDADGIAHAKRVFDEEKKFARALLVDTAYHSHHMLPCCEPYMESLRACDIKVNTDRSDTSCAWYSSVRGGELMGPSEDLSASYWRDNMLQAVLFMDAVKGAVSSHDNLNFCVEVGPHPALKGPAQQNISDARPSTLAYTGVLSRGVNDAEAFADGLGSLWTMFGPGAIDFTSLQRLVSPGYSPKLAVGLPSYAWNHSRVHWHESRITRKTMLRGAAFHELLGVPSPNNTDREFRWRNFLRADEIPWLDGHQLQGQTVFPAAGYVSMALEAAKELIRAAGGSRPVKVLEVHDLTIGKAIAFDEATSSAPETLVSLTATGTGRADDGSAATTQTALFSVYSCPNSTESAAMELVSSGKVRIVYGTPSFSTLSSSPLDDSKMTEIDSDRFYASLDGLGYGYNGPFRTMSSMKRRLDQASAKVATYGYGDDDDDVLTVHPSMLDVAFQASFLAQSSPGDEQLWSLHVPTSIGCIRVNPELCASLPTSPTDLPVSAILHASESISMISSVDIFSEDGQNTLLQVENLEMRPFSHATAADDRPMFSTTQFGIAAPDASIAAAEVERPSPDENDLAQTLDRVACYYLRQWKLEMTSGKWLEKGDELCQQLRDTATRLLNRLDSRPNVSVIMSKWAGDEHEQIQALLDRFSEQVDLKIIKTVGESVSAILRGDLDVSDFRKHELLDLLYSEGLGFSQSNTVTAKTVQQIMHRYPHAKVLEIDTRIGHATRPIVSTAGTTFSSYTCTDLSAEAVEKTQQSLAALCQKMVFKSFDPTKAPSSQGFENHSFDIIIASNTLLGGGPFLEKGLQNTRQLLRPGGYLIASGLSHYDSIRMNLLLGVLSDGFVDDKEESLLKKSITQRTATWHSALRNSGFAGIDTATPTGFVGEGAWPLSVVVAQAVDDRVNFLRKPLGRSGMVHLSEVVILGGTSLQTSGIAEDLCEMLHGISDKVTLLQGLPIDEHDIQPMTTFINLLDLDDPIFRDLTESTMEGLKCLFELASNILWVTEGARTKEPYHSASIGFGRSIAYEMPHLSLQFLDMDTVGEHAASLIAKAVLRLAAVDQWESSGTSKTSFLWSKEPELYVEGGRILVPRILPDRDQNARINSLRRRVTKTADLQNTTVFVAETADGSPALEEEEQGLHRLLPERPGSATKVSHSTLSAIALPGDGSLFVALGKDVTTGDTVVTLSDVNASKLVGLASVVVSEFVTPTVQAPVLLAAIAVELTAASIVSRLPANSHLLVHEPGSIMSTLAAALCRQAAAKSNNTRVTFSTEDSVPDDAEPDSVIQVRAWSSRHVIMQLLPTDVTHFLDLGNKGEGVVGSIIRDCLPLRCRQMDASHVIRRQAEVPPAPVDYAFVSKVLQEAVHRARTNLLPAPGATVTTTSSPQVIRPSEIRDAASSAGKGKIMGVIDWTSESSVPVQVRPVRADRLFSRDKTYVLVGLAGQLGQSLCEWMSRNGAGHVCLTSRNPKQDPKWQASLQKAGTTVKFFAMDVTDEKDVSKVINDIRASCPPIAGVANGAALFHDAPFTQMTLEMMTSVTRPKIEGTRNLDQVFGADSLDFFIVFSSLTSVIGNSGQSNYTAANAYMSGLIGQRKSRGLAGACLDIGRIAGIGFMERAGDTAREQLIRYGFMAISEKDVHELFAEAVLAGVPGSRRNPIVTTGCITVRSGEEESEEQRVQWFDDPRFSHKVIIDEAHDSDAKGTAGRRSALPAREQLATATTKDEAIQILEDCFAAKLAVISRLGDPAGVSHEVPLSELGIDSLVAVEVRSWFLKEVKVDMPVLKVLGGGSISDLCQQAAEKLPQDLLPNLGNKPNSSSPAKSGPAEAKTTSTPSPAKPGPAAAPPTAASKNPPSSESEAGSSSSESRPESILASSVEGSPRASDMETALVSFPQSRFWFLQHLVQDQTTFNVTFFYRITGALRTGDLERAVRLVTNRHESLRTAFVADNKDADVAWQEVLPRSFIRLERQQINSVEDVQTIYAAMKAIPFDLASGNLLRLILLVLSPTEHYLLVNYHHILMDGVSLQNFLADLEKAYQRQSLGSAPYQLPDLATRQRAAFANGEMDEDIAYWKAVFPDGHPPVLPLLPMAQRSNRLPMARFQVHQVETRLSSDLAARLRDVSKACRSTTFHVYLAVFKAMLFRFTDAEDLTIGIADANRNDSDSMGTIGLILNLLTLRFQRDLSQPFSDCVAEARAKAYEALAHSRVPFDVLLAELNVPRSAAYSPFFQAFFDYRQGQQEVMQFANTKWEFLDLHPGQTAYDMTLDVTDSPDSGARILFRTQAALYDATVAQLLLNTYVHLLETFVGDASLQLKDPPLFSDKECTRALAVGRGWDLVSSWPGGTLPHRIDQVAQENSDKVALKDGHGRVLSYAAMSDRTQAIAEALQQSGVGTGSRVLVFEDATADWPCSMLAIMRVGGVYIPLDLRNPLPRLADVAGACAPAVILVDDSTVGNAAEINVTGAKIVNVSTIGTSPSAPVANSAKPEDVAAILFTSGSTGKPKGIVVKHSGLRNEIEGYITQWGHKAECALQQSAFTFNHSSDQMYTGLVNGGSVVIVPWSKRGDPVEVTKIIREEGITYTKATPAEYSLWLEHGRDNLKQASQWRFAFGGGEPLTETLLRQIASLQLPNLRFFNSYGPTEISISSTKAEIPYRDESFPVRIPCGYSLPNYVAYILDEGRKPVPVGMPGELWIGGAGVSLGYLNNKELTDQHFLPDPYATPEYVAQGWTRMYRTGDIAHLQEDGAMVFHNRIAGDTQVKLRGLRIELGDIESNIVREAGGALKEAVVTLREGDPQLLVSHVVFAPQHGIADTAGFLRQLLRHLPVPQYMVPVVAIPLDRMPLNNHSKVDRKALKAMPLPARIEIGGDGQEDGTGRDGDAAAAGELSETMVQLRRLWEQALRTKETGLELAITPSTDFFTIGGNSLLVVRLQARIRQVLKVTVPLVELLGASTLSGMAQLLEQRPHVGSINWEEETAIGSDSIPTIPNPAPIHNNNKVILVTGAGGFLGKHILARLVASPSIARIHCIGLRDKPAGQPRVLDSMVASSPKIITHKGDLSEPWLGLGSEAAFVALAGEVDGILHLAAVRSFWDNYHVLRPSNVEPTRQLVRLAAARRVPLHYISTAGVVIATTAQDGTVGPARSADAYKPASDGSDGYVASRWVCEQMLEKASRDLGLPVSVHR